MPKVFKPLTAYERAQREHRERLKAAIKSMSPLDRIVTAKAAIVNRAGRTQGMAPSKAYADTPTGTKHYLRAFGRRPETITRDDRLAPTLPTVYIPRVQNGHGRATLRGHVLAKMREYSGVSRKVKGRAGK